MPNDKKTKEQLRSEIEKTRAEMDKTVDELEQRLDPERIKQEAQHKVREKTQQAARDIRKHPRWTISRLHHTVRRTIKEHPMPASLVGAGAALLFLKRAGGPNRERILVSYQEPPEDVAATIERGDYAPDARAHAGNRSLLGAMALALAAGLAIGRIFPDTQRERELRGERPDEFIAKVKSATTTAIEQAQQIIDEARLKTQLGRQEARDLADDVQSQSAKAQARAEGVANTTRRKTEEAKERATEVADQAQRKVAETKH